MTCCKVTSVYGRTLVQGMKFVEVMTSIAAIFTFIASLVVFTFVLASSKTKLLNANLILSINLLSSLYGICISIYQLVITLLLLKQTFWKLENMFLCWLWYVSHLNIIAFHAICFCANVVTYSCKGQTSMAVLIAVVAVIYEGILIYFVIIVNSYIDTLQTRVYY